MSNAFIPRVTVHEWSERIAADAESHQSALQRLLKSQRRLTRFIETERESLDGMTAGVCVYMTSVIARMFDLAGGSLRNATWEQVHAATAKVSAAVDALLPLDDGFVARFHAVDRAQPHILDEAAMVLFERAPEEGEQAALDPKASLKVLLISWVVTEVLDANWRPPSGFSGESSYSHVAIDPADHGAA